MAGEVNVDAMLRRITAKQFKEWVAFDQLDPIGRERFDILAARLERMIFQMAGRIAKDTDLSKPLKEFMVPWEPEDPIEKKRAMVERQIAFAHMLTAMVNASEDREAQLRAQQEREAAAGSAQ